LAVALVDRDTTATGKMDPAELDQAKKNADGFHKINFALFAFGTKAAQS